MKKICDEVFGEENYVACFPRITKKAGKTTDNVAKNHDFILLYTKYNISTYHLQKHTDEGFKNKDAFFEERGYYKLNQTLDYDSNTVERPFAAALDNDPDVKMFFKIPDVFKIETPIGTYNPDWAVYLDRDGVKKLYFVLETKGTTNLFDLRGPEQLKIHCGKRHFEALKTGAQLRVAKDWSEVKITI